MRKLSSLKSIFGTDDMGDLASEEYPIPVQPAAIAAASVAAAELSPAALEALEGGVSRKGSLAVLGAGEVRRAAPPPA
jgi:hypothetical protein